jgi:hypothetical protein
LTENRSVGGSIPPLGTIHHILSHFQIVVSGPRIEGRLFVRSPFSGVGLIHPVDANERRAEQTH